MNILNQRDHKSIESRFIQDSLDKMGKDIVSDVALVTRSFNSSKWRRTGITVSNNEMAYIHKPEHRFLDMKKRNGVKKKIQHPIHNKIIYRHKKFVIKQLSFGFTQQIIDQYKALENNTK